MGNHLFEAWPLVLEPTPANHTELERLLRALRSSNWRRTSTASSSILWSRPWKKSIYFLGISSYNRNPEPKKVLKYSTPKPSLASWGCPRVPRGTSSSLRRGLLPSRICHQVPVSRAAQTPSGASTWENPSCLGCTFVPRREDGARVAFKGMQ